MASVKGFFKKGYWSSPVVAAAGVMSGGWILYVSLVVLLVEAIAYKWMLDQTTADMRRLAELLTAGAITLRSQQQELERIKNARWN